MRARERNHSVVVELAGLASSVTWREVWNEITDLLRPLDLAIVYFLYKNGDHCAYITLADDQAAQSFLAFLFSDPRVIAGCEVSPRILEDKDDLESYWQKASLHMLERKKKQERYVRLNEQGANGQLNVPPRGVVISVDGIPPGTGWRRLMSELRNLGSVVFLNYPSDSSSCFVRLKDSETAESVVEQLSEPEPAMLLGTVVTAAVLEGEEETQYWRLAAAERRRKKADKQGHGNDHEENGHPTARSSGADSIGRQESTGSSSAGPQADDHQTATTMGVSESVQQSTHSG
jgi:RNA binding motif